MVATDLALALPYQDQAERGQRGAISSPLDLLDHEARWRPVDHAGALTDPQEPDGEREQADDQKQSAHGVSSLAPAARARALAVARVARALIRGKSKDRAIAQSSVPKFEPRHKKAPDDAGAFD